MKHTNTLSSLHVVYIITKLELGGAQKVCLSLFNGMHNHGITTNLIAGNEGILTSTVKNSSNTIFIGSLQREVSFQAFIQEIRCVVDLIKQLKQLKKVHSQLIVHTHSTKAGIIGRWAAFFARIPMRIHTVHGFAFHTKQNRLIWFIIYTAELLTSFITSHFICVSSYDVKIGIKLLPGFAKRHSIIRAAVDWEQFYTPARQASPFPTQTPFVFGTVACFKPQKNLLDLLQAFALVHQQHPHTKLEIIGDGAQRPFLQAFIKDHGLDTAVTLHGWQQQVAPIMLGWHAFVLSSLWEGLPCAIVEARLLKLPVICYDTGGIHDIIMHGENGFLINKGNWQELAGNMAHLCTDPTTYHRLQQYSDALQDFNDQAMVDYHAALYQQLHHHRSS